MKPRGWFAVGCGWILLLLMPITAASGPIVGTEENPELIDQAGDVNYDPVYQGSEDRDHLDILAVWFEYTPDDDNVSVVFKVATYEAMDDRVDGWSYQCNLHAEVTVANETVGLAGFQFAKREGAADWRSSASFTSNGRSSGFSTQFRMNETTPGYARVVVDRQPMLGYFEAVEGDYTAFCIEGQEFLPVDNINNSDNGQAVASYDLVGLRPAAVIDEGGDPTHTVPDQTESVTPTGDSATLLGVTVVAALFGATFLRRRNHGG